MYYKNSRFINYDDEGNLELPVAGFDLRVVTSPGRERHANYGLAPLV